MRSVKEYREKLSKLLSKSTKDILDCKEYTGGANRNGFYFDFEFSKNISKSILSSIQKEMEKDSSFEKGSYELENISGAYLDNDENNKMLTRISGIAFNTKEELEDFKKIREENKGKDHRKLGKEHELFHFSSTVGKGLPLYTEKGATIRRILERYIVDKEIKAGYQHISTPDIAKLDLYKKSGHYPYYKDSMYSPIKIDNEEYILRPMSCPHHFELYNSKPRSYKELPIRYAELAKLYRYERSGELTGLIRVRSFCLADAHIIVSPEKVREELGFVLDMIKEVNEDLEIPKENYSYRLSLGDKKNKEKYFNDPEEWEKSEKILKDVLNEKKLKYTEVKDEAAFYGPKIDVQMTSITGKEDTAYTIQYDFVMPKKFNMKYTDNDGKKKEPVVIHRSSIGAIDRLIAFLIEQYSAAFPVWLSPVQIALVPVTDSDKEKVNKIKESLEKEDIRVEVYDAKETVNKKILKIRKDLVPYFAVVGEKNRDNVTLTSRDEGHVGDVNTKNLVNIFK